MASSNSITEDQYHTIIKEAKELYNNSKLFLAASKYDNLLKLLELNNNDEYSKNLILKIKSDITYQIIKMHELETRKMLESMHSKVGWNILAENSASNSYYKQEKDSPSYTFRVEGKVNAPLLKVCAILYETDLFKSWFPMCVGSEDVKTLGRFRKFARFINWALWPYSSRENLIDGYGVDILEENSFLVFTKSIPNDITTQVLDEIRRTENDEKSESEILSKLSHDHLLLAKEYVSLGVKTIPDDKAPFRTDSSLSKYVRMEIHFCGFLLKPLGPHQSEVRLVFNIDPKISGLPYSILNWFCQQVVAYIIGMLEKACLFDEKSEYQKKINENPDVYDYIRSLINNIKQN